jgi:hypothetical protein
VTSPYSGIHAICHMNLDRQAQDFTEALIRERRAAGADERLGLQVRRLLLVSDRKTVRLAELQAMADAADAATRGPL